MKRTLISSVFLFFSLNIQSQFFTDLADWIRPLHTQLQEDRFFEDWPQGKQDSIERYLSILILCEHKNKMYSYWLGRVYTKTLSMGMPKSLDPITFDLTYFDKAKAIYMSLVALDSSDYLAYYTVGKLHLEKAILPLNMWRNIHVDSKEGMELYQRVSMFVKEEMAKALPYFQKAENLNPNHIPTLIQLSEIYARLDDFGMVKKLKGRIETIRNQEVFEASIFD